MGTVSFHEDGSASRSVKYGERLPSIDFSKRARGLKLKGQGRRDFREDGHRRS